MNNSLTPPALLDRERACLYLGGVSLTTLKMEIAKGVLPVVRIGRRVFLTRESLDQYINAHTVI